MNRILVIQLKRFGDLVATSQTIASIRQQRPHAEVSMLCFEEFAAIAKLIPSLKQTYTISRNTLLTLRGGKLYNNGFALDEIQKRLAPVSEQKWDQVVNISNDKASAYITSWIASFNPNIEIQGISIAKNTMLIASNAWSLVYNEVITASGFNSPFNFRDIWAQMNNVNDIGPSPLLTNAKNEETVRSNFNSLRKNGARVIGIQAHCSVEDKGISASVISDVVMNLTEAGHRCVLLSAPFNDEREKVSQIIGSLDFKPIVIECDFTALSSVVKNLDLLITPDTVTKHFADAHNVSCVEVSLGSSPTFKQATTLSKSRLLVARSRNGSQIPADDIYNTALALLDNKNYLNVSHHATAYAPVQIGNITCYQAYAGEISFTREFERFACTARLLEIASGTKINNSQFAEVVFQTPRAIDNFNAWAAFTKNQSTEVMREVLHAIRSLLQMRENPRRSSEFIESLEKIFGFANEVTTANCALYLFRARIEALPAADFASNALSIEKLLFELKAELQNTLALVNDWEKNWSAAKFSIRKTRTTNVENSL